MFVQLQATDSMSGQPSGTLQVFSKTTAGETELSWEWMGGPDVSDGGPWSWRVDTRGKSPMPYMELTSNVSGRVSAQLWSERWSGPTAPPAQPWFPPGRHEDAGLLYYAPGGLKRPFDWDVK